MNIAQHPTIKKELFARWIKLGMKDSDVLRDANERSPEMKIERTRFSRWRNNKIEPSGAKLWLSDTQVSWLCTRWGIFINLNFGKPSLTVDGRLQWTIPEYDELECLKKLKIIFNKPTVILLKTKKKK